MAERGSPEKVERIVLTAMSRDPSLEEPVARTFAAMAVDLTDGPVDVDDAPELARRMMVADHAAGASAASVVAAAAVDVLSTDG